MTMDDLNPRAVIGANNPPDPIDETLAPYGDAIEEAQNWLDGEPIQNEDQLKATDALLKIIKSAIKDLNHARDEVTKPLHDAWKAEIARWKPTQDDLERIAKGLVACQDPFKRALAAKKEAEKRAAWEAADKARREAEEAARNAAMSDITAQREAAQKAAEAQRAVAEASAKQKDTVKGMRTVHLYEITDHRAALNWIARNDRDAITAFIEAYVDKNHKAMDIDGVRQWTEKQAF
jgi:membrane protein involved in colicin uptake